MLQLLKQQGNRGKTVNYKVPFSPFSYVLGPKHFCDQTGRQQKQRSIGAKALSKGNLHF